MFKPHNLQQTLTEMSVVNISLTHQRCLRKSYSALQRECLLPVDLIHCSRSVQPVLQMTHRKACCCYLHLH